MGVSRQSIATAAGYVPDEGDEAAPELDIRDPEVSLFFRGYDWDEFTHDEQEIIRTAIRMALQVRKAREAGTEGKSE